jgi:hypothetical protein
MAVNLTDLASRRTHRTLSEALLRMAMRGDMARGTGNGKRWARPGSSHGVSPQMNRLVGRKSQHRHRHAAPAQRLP